MRVPLHLLIGTGFVIFIANAGLLVLQLVAGRYLAPFIGSSIETWTSVIGVFLTGIAVGNWLGGRLADRAPSTRTLAVLLLLGSMGTLAMVGWYYLSKNTGFYRAIPLTPRIPILAMLFCFLPAFFLSLLTPLTIKLALPDVSRAGRVAGMIFALSTLGCLLGNYLTGFWLMAEFELDTITISIAVMLLAAAVATFFMNYTAPSSAASLTSVVTSTPAKAPSPSEKDYDVRTNIRIAYLIVFLSSFCGMSLELTATRILAPILGVSIYTWTGVIGVMLAGTVVGNSLGGIIADRTRKGENAAESRLAMCFLAAGIFLILVFLTVFRLWNEAYLSESRLIVRVMGWTFTLFFVPMVLLGMISPQVIRLSVSTMGSAGRTAGSIYAWSTVGAIVGTFATGYFLIAQVGMFRILLGVACLLTLLAFFVGRLWKYNVMLYAASVVTGGGIVGLFAIGLGTDKFDLETKYYAIKVHHTDVATLYHQFGVPPGERTNTWTMQLDSLAHSYVDLDDPTWLGYKHEEVQAELLYLAAKRHENPNLLVIGGGGYTFPRWVEHSIPQVNVDVVEIDPGVTEVARRKLGLRRDSRIKSIHMDGRQFVAERAEKEKYHLVMQDAVNDLSVPWHLLTKEYNDAVKTTLAEDGAFLLTVIDSLEDGELWRAAVHTLRRSFKHVTLLSPDDFYFKARQVYVIYASDHALDREALWEATKNRPFRAHRYLPMMVLAPPESHLVAIPLARYDRWWTQEITTEGLDYLLSLKKPVVLTDQYAPVDNLMQKVFRER